MNQVELQAEKIDKKPTLDELLKQVEPMLNEEKDTENINNKEKNTQANNNENNNDVENINQEKQNNDNIDKILQNSSHESLNEKINSSSPNNSQNNKNNIKELKQKQYSNSTSKTINKKSQVKQIIFARHGQTQESQQSIIIGQEGGNLTKRGVEEAKKIGKFISKAKIDKVFISDLKRVQDSFEEIQKLMVNKVTDVEKEPLLRDINLGKYNGLSIKDKKVYLLLKDMNNDRNKKGDLQNGGESWNDVEQRLIQFWENLVENYLKKDDVRSILIMSHKGCVSSLLENAYLSKYMNVEENIKFFNMPLNNGEMIVMKLNMLMG